MLYSALLDINTNQLFAQILTIVLCVVAGYFLGSLNFGIILSKKLYNQDVRSFGSGNAGSTNMLRNYGWKTALMTLGGDMLKTALAVVFGFLLFPMLGMFISGLSCMLGHMFPIYYKFKGGKGVASFAVILLITCIIMGKYHLLLVFLPLLVIFFALVIGTKYVSLGAIITSMLYPVLLNRINAYIVNVNETFAVYQSVEIFAVVIALLVVFQHRENIGRLLNGKENKINLKKKNKKAEAVDNETNETK